MTAMTFALLLSMLGNPDCTSVLSGRVIDADSGEALSRTRIEVSSGGQAVRSKADGSFRIEGLCSGALHIQAVRSDYALRVIKLDIDQARQLEIFLKPIRLTQEADLIVRAPQLKESDTRSVVSLEGDALLRTRGKNLADALADLPGISVLRSGNSAKPIIRGQHGSRILMLYDGVRHEGQDWGLSHGPELDPFAAGAMHVVKGSAGVRYGPDALAGVLIVEPPKLLKEPGIRMETQTIGALNGKRGTMAARIDGNHQEVSELSWRVDGNYSRGSGLQTPNYPLDNTGVEEWNVGGIAEYQGDCWSLKLSFRHNDNRSGTCLCVRKETTADFDAQVLSDTPPYVELYEADYEIDRPFQKVTHDIVLLRGALEIEDVGDLEATYAFQINVRGEYEIVRTATSFAQHNFKLRTHTADILFRHKPVPLGQTIRLEGILGVTGMLQENVYRGWPLLSDYRGYGGGIFAIERLVMSRWELEFGARFDHITRNAYLPKKTYQSLNREGRIDPESCIIGEDFTQCDSNFNAGTLSLGSLIKIAEGISAKLDFSTATRMPTIDEQYLNGTSPSFPVMARGRHDLGPETSWSTSATLKLDYTWLKSEVSVYGSYIDDYIYLAPELREDGTVRTDVLIQGRFPRFNYNAINAIYYGFDAEVQTRMGPIELGVDGSVVRAFDVDLDSFLL